MLCRKESHTTPFHLRVYVGVGWPSRLATALATLSLPPDEQTPARAALVSTLPSSAALQHAGRQRHSGRCKRGGQKCRRGRRGTCAYPAGPRAFLPRAPSRPRPAALFPARPGPPAPT